METCRGPCAPSTSYGPSVNQPINHPSRWPNSNGRRQSAWVGAHQQVTDAAGQPDAAVGFATSRRLLPFIAGGLLVGASGAGTAAAGKPTNRSPLAELVQAAPPAWPASSAVDLPRYDEPGPFQPGRLPLLEHTCYNLYPLCTGDRCKLRLSIFYPKGGTSVGLKAPYPLAIITSGFLVGSEQYLSYAERLVSGHGVEVGGACVRGSARNAWGQLSMCLAPPHAMGCCTYPQPLWL
jgi:hypothetical protein